MPLTGPPTKQEIWKIARRTTDIIDSYISENVCLFGSAGSSLWTDIGRVPNDIDIVVSEDFDGVWDPEDIKDEIVVADNRLDNRYYLERSRQRGATHKILYCHLPGWKTDPGRRVKVDILVPPTLGLSEIDAADAFVINDIPVILLFDLLIMKTQG